MSDERFEPKIIAFLCNWCSYRAADLAGTARMKYQPNIRTIRVMCSGRVDPAFVLKGFALGADGVMIAGCHPGECHYLEQNYKAMRPYEMLRHTLLAMGMGVRAFWRRRLHQGRDASAAAGPRCGCGDAGLQRGPPSRLRNLMRPASAGCWTSCR